jgi:hypothetical protein
MSKLARAWKLLEKGKPELAKPIFLELTKGVVGENAWYGLALCVRDAPGGHTPEDFYKIALTVYTLAQDHDDQELILGSIANICLPLWRYTISLRTYEWSRGTYGKSNFDSLEISLQPLIDWMLQEISKASSTIELLVTDKETLINFYENLNLFSDQINDERKLRFLPAGQTENRYLKQIAQVGLAKHGRWGK